MSRTSDLLRLQSLDQQLAQKHARLKEIERILSYSKELAAAKQRLSDAETRLKDARGVYSKAEHAVERQRLKLSNNEKMLYGGSVTNPKELEDLQKEAVSLRKYLSTLEDQMLEAMIALESVEDQHTQAQKTLQTVKKMVAEQQQDLTGEKKDLLDAVEHLRQDRSSMAANVLPDDLDLYTELQQDFGTQVIALLDEDSCGTCGLQLARSALQDARNGKTISRCPQCRRILFASG